MNSKYLKPVNNYPPLPDETERIAKLVVDSAYVVHKTLGAGLLESVYEPCFCLELQKRGLALQRQVLVPIFYDGIKLDEHLRLDVLVENRIICELKAIDEILSVHQAQLLAYLNWQTKDWGFSLTSMWC